MNYQLGARFDAVLASVSCSLSIILVKTWPCLVGVLEDSCSIHHADGVAS